MQVGYIKGPSLPVRSAARYSRKVLTIGSVALLTSQAIFLPSCISSTDAVNNICQTGTIHTPYGDANPSSSSQCSSEGTASGTTIYTNFTASVIESSNAEDQISSPETFSAMLVPEERRVTTETYFSLIECGEVHQGSLGTCEGAGFWYIVGSDPKTRTYGLYTKNGEISSQDTGLEGAVLLNADSTFQLLYTSTSKKGGYLVMEDRVEEGMSYHDLGGNAVTLSASTNPNDIDEFVYPEGDSCPATVWEQDDSISTAWVASLEEEAARPDSCKLWKVLSAVDDQDGLADVATFEVNLEESSETGDYRSDTTGIKLAYNVGDNPPGSYVSVIYFGIIEAVQGGE